MPSLPPTVKGDLFYDGEWNSISRDIRQTSSITITRGAGGESDAPEPMEGELVLNNRGNKFSPRSLSSDLFKKIGRNTPIRFGYEAGSPWGKLTIPPPADLPTDDALVTANSATLDVAGDFDLRLDLSLEEWTRSQMLALRYVPSANECWALEIVSGVLTFLWSPDGTFANRLDVEATEALNFHNGERAAIRVTLDINNGAGGHVVRFYRGHTIDDEDGDWKIIGAPITGVGTTSVFTGTAQLEFGSGEDFNALPSGGALGRMVGSAYGLKLLDGSTVKVRMTTEDASPGATSFTSGVLLWTVRGEATMTNRHIRMAGEVPAWPPSRDLSGNDTVVALRPVGVMRRLDAGNKPLESALMRYLKSQEPLECWPMTDGELSTGAGALFGSRDMVVSLDDGTSLPKWSEGSLADWIEPVVLLPLDTDGTIKGSVGNKSEAATGWSVEFAYQGLQDLDFTVADRGGGTDDNPRVGWTFELDVSSNNLTLSVASVGDTTSSLSLLATISSVGLFDGNPHMIRLTTEVSGANALYEVFVDGISVASGTAVARASKAVLFVRPGWFYGSVTQDAPSIGFVTYWGATAPPASDVYNALIGFQGETAGTRALRLAAESAITLSVSGQDEGQVLMGVQRRDKLIPLLETCAQSDLGFSLERRDVSELIYRSHTSLENLVPTLTLDFSSGVISSPFKPIDDDKLSENDVTVLRDGGTVGQRSVLETGAMSVLDPPDGIGRYDVEHTRSVFTDEDAAVLAGWYLHLGTFDGYRFPKITLNLANPRVYQMIDAILRADVGHIIRLTNLPEQYSIDAVDVLIRGYEESFGPQEWTIAFSCAPGGVWTIANAADDDEDFDGPAVRADTDSELTNNITATATSFQVTCPGATWMDSASFGSEFPFDVRVGGVGGEVMRVTACTSATSPQTFTVTRGINGHSRAWDAGEDVRLNVTPIVPL